MWSSSYDDKFDAMKKRQDKALADKLVELLPDYVLRHGDDYKQGVCELALKVIDDD